MPFTITEELTNQTWVMSVPAAPLVFVFNGPPWKPGVYKVANTMGYDVIIILFGQGFTMADQRIWRFMAHQDLESFSWITPTVGQEESSYNFSYRSFPDGYGSTRIL